MDKLLPILTEADIPAVYAQTPIGKLLRYHNLDSPYEVYSKAQLLVGMCMDNRKHLHIPDNFAYIIRSGGANLQHSEFKVAYAIAVGQVKHIALIGHNHCGMVNLVNRRDEFVNGLVQNAGWDLALAKVHFEHFAPKFEIRNEIDFVKKEAARLRLRYPLIQVAPMIYLVEDNKLYLCAED